MPQIPPEFVHRPRLTERVQRGVQGPLTLLAAPAGFGKTNLLIEWAEKADLAVAWLTLDREDNDLGRFIRYLIGALQTLEPRLGEEALDFFQSTKGGGLEVGLTLLINELSAHPKELALVLDEFQVLENPAILHSLVYCLKHIPHNLHLVIASRSEPDLDLAFLRAKGRILELGAADLRFTGEEVAQFFQQALGLQLPPTTIRALEKRTEGWVTALQMAVISLRHQTDPIALLDNLQGDAHYLVDFLAEEVLDRQPEEIRQFLLRSSILDTLTGPLCEAVIKPEAQPGYGMVMLNRLEHANLFITALDEKHEWFRYHPLFVDFLRHIHAEINLAEIPELQKRAALWFERNADLDGAFRFALSTGDAKWTADLIERNIQEMIRTGEIFSLTRWLGKLPDEMIRQRPRLSLTYAWGLIAAYQLDLARYWIEDLQRVLNQLYQESMAAHDLEEAEILQDIDEVGLWNVRGGLAVCQSTLAMLSGDVERAAELSTQATDYLQEENPFIRSMLALDESLYFILSGDTPRAIETLRDTVRIARQSNNLLVMIIATCQLAEMQTLHGELSLAWATLQKAQYMILGPEGNPLPLAGMVEVELGEILLERGALDEASAYLERGCQATQSLWSISSLDGMVALARLRQGQGDIDGSRSILAEAAHMAISTESSKWDDAIVSTVAVRLALLREDLVDAEQWWKKGGFPELTSNIALETYPYHVFEYVQLTHARFLLRTGQEPGNAHDLQHAIELLETLLREAVRFQRVTSQIEILVLLALARFALRDERATQTLLQALALGEPEGYRQVYLDEGRRLFQPLQHCRYARRESGDHLPSLAFIEDLLEAIQRTDSALEAAAQPGRQWALEQPVGTAHAHLEDGLPVTLSARELEVLKLIAAGKSNQEISAQLYLALNTVKRHAYNIYAKLEVKKRTQAVSKARQLGFIP